MHSVGLAVDIAVTIYGEEAVIQMLEDGIEIPLHTVQGWAARGPYRVKKNEHGLECRLWKKKTSTSESTEADKFEDEPTNRDFYLCKSFLFRADQVEKVCK